MKKIVFIIVILTITFQGCENCNDNCVSPPKAFRFDLVDKNTFENLFSNGTFNPNDISVINDLNNSKVDYSFVHENNINRIIISSIGWRTEKINITLKISNDEILRLYVDAIRETKDCCDFTQYKEIRIDNAEYEYNNHNGVHTILID